MRMRIFALGAIAAMLLAMVGVSGTVMGEPAATTATMTVMLDTGNRQLTIQFVGEQEWDLAREFRFVPKGIALEEGKVPGVYQGECKVKMVAPRGEEVYIVVPANGAGNAEGLLKVCYDGELPVSLLDEHTMVIGPISVDFDRSNRDSPDVIGPIIIERRPNQDDPD